MMSRGNASPGRVWLLAFAAEDARLSKTASSRNIESASKRRKGTAFIVDSFDLNTTTRPTASIEKTNDLFNFLERSLAISFHFPKALKKHSIGPHPSCRDCYGKENSAGG